MEEKKRTIANNKKAYHDYHIEDTFEAGIVLTGSEVKSVRLGECNLRDSFIFIRGNVAEIIGMHIAPYSKGSHYNPDPGRNRQLLLNRDEMIKLKSLIDQKGYTIVPLCIYFKQALIKLEIGVAKGKDLYDKRHALREKQEKRETERDLKFFKNREEI